MLKTTTISLRKTLVQCVTKVNNHHLPSYSTDILTIGILVALFSFVIGMFLNVVLFSSVSNTQDTSYIHTTALPQQPQLPLPRSHISTSQDDKGIQTSRDLILTSIRDEQESTEQDNQEQVIEQENPDIAFKGTQYRVRRTMNMTFTAYSSTPDQTDSTPFITASNTRVRWGTVAANILPFQTKVRIPQMFGDKVFVVEDRMNKRYWHRVDVWMPTRQEAINFGIRTLRIEILEPVPPIQTI